MKSTFYITTPIYYVNDIPHIGHAYTTIAADVLARYHRLTGTQTFFLTGTDEHGQKVQQAAKKNDVDPQAYTDSIVTRFQDLWQRLSISNSDFIRTTETRHTTVVREILDALFKKEDLYENTYEGWYCLFDERFWTEKDVIDGSCPDCHRPVERIKELNYFFRMGRHQDWLIKHIKTNPNFIRPESRRNEVLGFLQRPLEDLCISRPKNRLSWGIPLPFAENYVTYVWFDALVNYISAIGYLADDTQFKTWWPASVHLVGKDILTTHSVYWTTMLHAMGLEMPKTIFAHGWWTIDGEKMSKSRGNAVDPNAIIQEFGVDAFRYFLLREVPFGQDGDFSKTAMVQRINSELANDVGNLLNRSLTMVERFAGGIVPPPIPSQDGDLEREIKEAVRELKDCVDKRLGALEFHLAIQEIWRIVELGNQYIERSAPWKLAKDPTKKETLENVLYTQMEILYWLTLFFYPFMPHTSEAMAKQLGITIHFSDPVLATPKWGTFPPGTTITKGQPLFPRIETNPTKPEQETAPPTKLANQPEASQIGIEDFMKVQLKTGKVIAAEAVPKSKKLLRLQVDIGAETRQIVAGIATKYSPDDLIGKLVVIVANLKPAKLMGIESQGMVLAAGDKEVEGLLSVVEPVNPGTKVK